jgi:nucleotide-binding universal stress UspA family protein
MPTTIIVPIDLSQLDAGAKALAAARQYDPDGKLILLYVVAPIPSEVALDLPAEVVESQKTKAREALAAFADRNGVASSAEFAIRTGHAGREILRHAKDTRADMIVIASHDPRWGDFLLGSVAAFVVRHAHCSVFVVREAEGS